MTELKPKPVGRLETPGYPTKLEVDAQPGLLEKHLPPGWRAVEEVAKAATVLLAATLPACARPAPPVEPERPVEAEAGALAPEADAATEGAAAAESGTVEGEGGVPPSAAAVVAPIFEHGEGYGSVGCVVTCPPVFLSEEEAFGVIAAELERVGVRLTRRAEPVPGVLVAGPASCSWEGGASQATLSIGAKQPLAADGIDPERRVAVEFVSAEDEDEARGGLECIFFTQGSVHSNQPKWSATELARRVAEQGRNVTLGVFYDPMEDSCSGTETVEVPGADGAPERYELPIHDWEGAQERSRELLRLQVRDFVEWLKGQGAI